MEIAERGEEIGGEGWTHLVISNKRLVDVQAVAYLLSLNLEVVDRGEKDSDMMVDTQDDKLLEELLDPDFLKRLIRG